MLNTADYLNALQNITRKQINAERALRCSMDKTTGDQNANMYQFVSANLHYLLPEIPLSVHPPLIDEILQHQTMAALDEDSYFLMEHTDIVDPGSLLTLAKDKPVIFCTFHFGSFRFINMILVSRNLSYVLPVESHVYEQEKSRYVDHVEKGKAHFHSRSEFLVVNAEEPTAALTMARKAKMGWSLLGYLDGNTGVQGSERHDLKLLKISLLGRQIYARKGIAFLAHFLNLPIVPVFCEITGPTGRRLTFHDPIEPPDSKSDREEFCRSTTQALHALLGTYIKRSPTQWAGWIDLQKHLDLDNTGSLDSVNLQVGVGDGGVVTVTARKLVFNHERFAVIQREGEPVLLDKLTYEFLAVPENLYVVLNTCREPVAISDYMPKGHKETIEQLLSLKLLIPAA